MLLLCFSGTKFNTMNSVSALIIQRFLDKVHNTVNVTIPLLPGEKDIIKTLSHARSCVVNEYLYTLYYPLSCIFLLLLQRLNLVQERFV